MQTAAAAAPSCKAQCSQTSSHKILAIIFWVHILAWPCWVSKGVSEESIQSFTSSSMGDVAWQLRQDTFLLAASRLHATAAAASQTDACAAAAARPGELPDSITLDVPRGAITAASALHLAAAGPKDASAAPRAADPLDGLKALLEDAEAAVERIGTRLNQAAAAASSHRALKLMDHSTQLLGRAQHGTDSYMSQPGLGKPH